LWAYSSTPLLDVVQIFKLTIFCFLTGNSDMHLKNFSLLYDRRGRVRLSPAYDLLPTQLLLPTDKEESALTINGKKAKLKREDFHKLAQNFRLTDKQEDNVYCGLQEALQNKKEILDCSHASLTNVDSFSDLIAGRLATLGL